MSVLDYLIGVSIVMIKLKDILIVIGLGIEDQYLGFFFLIVFYDVGLMLVVLCLFIMIIVLFGCCGGCCKLKCVLLIVCIVIIYLERERELVQCCSIKYQICGCNMLIINCIIYLIFQYIVVSCFFLVLELIVVIIVYGDEDLVCSCKFYILYKSIRLNIVEYMVLKCKNV